MNAQKKQAIEAGRSTHGIRGQGKGKPLEPIKAVGRRSQRRQAHYPTEDKTPYVAPSRRTRAPRAATKRRYNEDDEIKSEDDSSQTPPIPKRSRRVYGGGNQNVYSSGNMDTVEHAAIHNDMEPPLTTQGDYGHAYPTSLQAFPSNTGNYQSDGSNSLRGRYPVQILGPMTEMVNKDTHPSGCFDQSLQPYVSSFAPENLSYEDDPTQGTFKQNGGLQN